MLTRTENNQYWAIGFLASNRTRPANLLMLSKTKLGNDRIIGIKKIDAQGIAQTNRDFGKFCSLKEAINVLLPYLYPLNLVNEKDTEIYNSVIGNPRFFNFVEGTAQITVYSYRYFCIGNDTQPFNEPNIISAVLNKYGDLPTGLGSEKISPNQLSLIVDYLNK